MCQSKIPIGRDALAAVSDRAFYVGEDAVPLIRFKHVAGRLWVRCARAQFGQRHQCVWADGASAASVAVYLTRGQYATGTEGRRRPAQTFFSCASPYRSSSRPFTGKFGCEFRFETVGVQSNSNWR